ncbi:hypothetical protein BDZ45DRAFT_346592 [Acephala macrosclerotiorum]|nr:hypothetical protein BDZ45DRAFT_346592 [Acephala macrosclerotiorum]
MHLRAVWSGKWLVSECSLCALPDGALWFGLVLIYICVHKPLFIFLATIAHTAWWLLWHEQTLSDIHGMKREKLCCELMMDGKAASVYVYKVVAWIEINGFHEMIQR